MPDTPAGQIASGQTQLAQPLTVPFDNVPSTLLYDGLALEFGDRFAKLLVL